MLFEDSALGCKVVIAPRPARDLVHLIAPSLSPLAALEKASHQIVKEAGNLHAFLIELCS